MARAATGLCFAMQEYQNGGLRPETRLANGERIARLFELQEATLGEIDFSLVAREQGRIALRRYLDANDFYCHHSAEQGDAVLEMCIDDVLAVVAKVTAFERAMANWTGGLYCVFYFSGTLPSRVGILTASPKNLSANKTISVQFSLET